MLITDYTDKTQEYWRNESGNTAILPDITNPEIIQDETDPSILHLTWDNLNVPDFSHYQIRISKEWKPDTTDKHCKIYDYIRTNSIDIKLTNYFNGIVDIRIWIAGYDLLKNRSKNPVLFQGIYHISPGQVTNLVVKQDLTFRNNILISWDYEGNLDLIDKFIVTIEEEDCPPYITSTKYKDFNHYWARHNGLLKVTVAPQYQSGSIVNFPIKNLYQIDLTPKPVEELKAKKNEFGFTVITWKDEQVHQSGSDLVYEVLINKEDKVIDNLKIEEQTNGIQTGFVNDKNTVLGPSIALDDRPYHHAYEVYRNVTKQLTSKLLLPEGEYKIIVTPHLHDFYVSKDGKRIDYDCKGKSSIIIFRSENEFGK